MNAMELRALAQEALARAGTSSQPVARLRLLKFADRLTTIAREQQDEDVREERKRHRTIGTT